MILALLLQAAAPAPPQTPPPGAPGRLPPQATVMAEPMALAFAGWDADGDGRTTRAEAMAGAGRGFAALDGGRGSLGYLGFADWAERWLGDRAALPSPFEVDADADDRITRAEFDAGVARAFDRLDKDKDGVLVRSEMLTIRPGLRGPDDRRRGRDRDRGSPPPR